MKEFTGFKPEHVGETVTYISKMGVFNGRIVRFEKDAAHPIKMKALNNAIYSFTQGGFQDLSDSFRTLYFGHNIKVEVTGEEIPEQKLICPVCGVEHDTCASQCGWIITGTNEDCPFHLMRVVRNTYLADMMKNLIKAMEKK